VASSVENVVYVNCAGEVYNNALVFLKQLPAISLDTETTGTDPLIDKVLLISAGNPYKQFVFNVYMLEKAGLLDPIRAVLSDTSKTYILHNAKFDYKFLKRCLGIELENIYDTMLAEMLLLKGRKMQGFGLDDVADKYLGIKLNKDIRKTFIGLQYGSAFTLEQIRYSGIDVQHLDVIRAQQYALIKKHGLETVCDIEMKAVPPTGDMELNGMYLSASLWSKAETQAIKDRDAAKETLDKLFSAAVGQDMFGNAMINYNSPKQLLPALRTLIGKQAEGLESTGEAVLRELLSPGIYDRMAKEGMDILDTLKEQSDKVVAALLLYREKEKRISTYGNDFLSNIHVATNRVHSDFSQLYTDTGRYSSSNPNLQNIPAITLYRQCFRAWSEDYRIIGCDYSGMELRILADLSQEPSWIDCFKRNGDLHAENGSALLGKTIRKKGTNGPNDPGENWELRRPVKTLNFGVGYGMGPMKLANATGMPLDQARGLIKQFWTKFSKVKGFFDTYTAQAFQEKCVRSPYDGRLRWLDGFDYDSRKDQSRMRNLCMNFPMQAGNATIMKYALYLIRRDLKGKDAKIICTVHDECLVEAHKDIAQEVYDIVRKDMIDAGQRFIKNVPVDVEGHISMQWEK
jgi:DNA polymerase I